MTQAMSRDVSKLRVFKAADDLLMQVYRATSTFPSGERYGLQSQLRRAALSIPVNIVEGSARRTRGEYVNFLNVATASSAEVTYLLSVARRLGFIESERGGELEDRYRALLKSLKALLRSLESLTD
jgi:four helix bundle protein